MNDFSLPLIVRPAQQRYITGLPLSTAWMYARDPSNDFPSPRKLGPNVSGWLRDELVAWARSRKPLYPKDEQQT